MKKRIEYIDIMRGICIIYMIAGHIDFQCVYFDHYIHAFHMPIFFIVSGLFYKNNMKSDYITKLAKKTLLPYFVWATIFLIIDNITFLGTHTGFRNGLSIILTTNNNNIPISGALWFLTAFFISNVIYYFISKINIKTLRTIICLIIMLIGIYLYKLTNINLWWSINASLVGVGLLEIGYLFKQHNLIEKVNIKSNLLLILIIIINTICIMKTSYVNMRTNIYPLVFMFIINILLSLIVYLNISKRLEKFKISDSIKLLGKESIIPLCINQFIILFYTTIIEKIILKGHFNNYIIFIRLFIFILSLVTIYFMTKLFCNTKLKKVFGK